MVASEELLNRLSTAVWIYCFQHRSIVWCNRAALGLWDASSEEELKSRDLGAGMAPKLAQKLAQYHEDLETSDQTFVETWTFYPQGRPRQVEVECSGVRDEQGTLCMLVQARKAQRPPLDSVRAVDALNHTSVMISLFEKGGRRLYCNPAARAVFGGSEYAFRDRFEDQSEADAFLAAIDTDGMAGTIYRVATPGKTVWHHVFGAPCRDAITGQAAYLFSESDVTLAQEAQAALRAAHTDAVRTTKLKTDFLARMSHEIRTPVNGVIGAADLLDSRIKDPDDRELLKMVVESGEALLRVVNGVLDLSKIEAGGLDLEALEFRPAELGDRVRSIHSVKAAEHDTRLLIEMDAASDVSRIGDPHRILQILNNLVSNALRFASGGEVRLSIGVDAEDQVTFSVRDTGIGMTREEIGRIFESYVQADASTTRKYGGTGLGMPISRALAETMGGRIEVESEPGVGTVVTVTLPLERVQEAEMAEPDDTETRAAGQASASDERRISVLAADDDATNRLVLQSMAARLGLAAEVVASGEESVARVKQTSFDLLMLDISMPGMDGIATLRAIREFEAAEGRQETPAIAVTANVFQHQIDSYLAAGFFEHLPKPLRLEQMSKAVERAVSVSEQG